MRFQQKIYISTKKEISQVIKQIFSQEEDPRFLSRAATSLLFEITK